MKKRENREDEQKVRKLQQIEKNQMRKIEDKEDEIKMERSCINRGEGGGGSWIRGVKKSNCQKRFLITPLNAVYMKPYFTDIYC